MTVSERARELREQLARAEQPASKDGYWLTAVLDRNTARQDLRDNHTTYLAALLDHIDTLEAALSNREAVDACANAVDDAILSMIAKVKTQGFPAEITEAFIGTLAYVSSDIGDRLATIRNLSKEG